MSGKIYSKPYVPPVKATTEKHIRHVSEMKQTL